MKKFSQVWHGRVLDISCALELKPKRDKVRFPDDSEEQLVLEPIVHSELIRISDTVVKKVKKRAS